MGATKLMFTGGCYCGEVRYKCEGPPLMRGQCYCLTCQMISGGAGNLFMAVCAQSFEFTKGTPPAFYKRGRPGGPPPAFFHAFGGPLPPTSDPAAGVWVVQTGRSAHSPAFE